MPRLLSTLLFSAVLACASNANAGDFSEPRPGLHTGGQPTAAQLDALAAQGVRTVIDLRTDGEDRGFDEAGAASERHLRYLHLPISGASDLTPANAEKLAQLLRANPGGVLLHCASGNRVGALLALMAAQQEHLPPEQALALGRKAGLKSLEPTVEQALGLAPKP